MDKKSVLVLLLCISSATAVNLVVFGDSLSDTGNLFAQMTECGFDFVIPPEQFGYFEGRYSSGPVFTERVCELLDMDLVTYAYSSAFATTDINFTTPTPPCSPIPGLISQISSFAADVQAGSVCSQDSAALVFAGGNDLMAAFNQTSFQIAEGFDAVYLQVIETAIDLLASTGIKHILLGSLPAVNVASATLITDDMLKLQAPNATVSFPQSLESYIVGVNAELEAMASGKSTENTAVQYLDMFAAFTSVVAALTQEGLEPKENCLGVKPTDPQDFWGTPCTDPDSFIFIDNVHPTGLAHAAFGEELVASYSEEFEEILSDLGAWGCDGLGLAPEGAATPAPAPAPQF